jgi:N-methylhydantoinase A
LKDVRETYFDGYGYVRTAVYDRDRLAPGMQFGGPAIVEQNDATTLLPPNTPAQVDDFGNIIIRLK